MPQAPHRHYTLMRRCPRTGYIERITYTGPLRSKPAGWRIEKAA